LGVLSELSDELFNELSSTSSQRVQFLQMDKKFLDDPVEFVQRVRAQHPKCRELYVSKSVSMKFSNEIMQHPMVVALLCMLYGIELLCNRDSDGWCRFTKLHNSMPEIKDLSKAAMTKLAMHFTTSSYCSALDLNDGDVVIIELWNYQTSDKHAPMACDQGQLDLKIPSVNRNGCIQSRLNTTDIVSRKLHTIKNDSDNDACSDVVIFDSDYDTLSDLYKSKLIIGESSNLLFTKEDKAGKRLANEFMHFKISNDQSVYQILRGVERKVLASVASDLRFAYFTFGKMQEI